jgi:hypothetical protein
MPPAPLEVRWPQIQCAQFIQIFRTHAGEFIQQLPQGFTLTLLHVSPTIKGLKRAGLAEFEDHPRPRHPVSVLGVNQMADHIERAESIFTFIAERPRFWQITQKRSESSGGAGEQ